MDTVDATVMDNITKLVPTSKLVYYLASLLVLRQDMNSAFTFGVKGLCVDLIAEMCWDCFPGMPDMVQKPMLGRGKGRTAVTPYTASMCLTGQRRWLKARQGPWTYATHPRRTGRPRA